MLGRENEYLVVKTKKHFSEHHETYGSPRITIDLNELRFPVSGNRMARLIKQAKIAPF